MNREVAIECMLDLCKFSCELHETEQEYVGISIQLIREDKDINSLSEEEEKKLCIILHNFWIEHSLENI